MGKKKTGGGNITLVTTPHVINVDYQLLVAERDDLLEAEIGYKRCIEQLEKDSADTLKSFDILYNENKILRSKLDSPDGIGADSIESYNSVYKDREHLREANRAFKRRIRQLEDDAAESQKSYNKLYQNHQLVTQKAQLETEYATKARDEKITDIEKDNEEMNERLKMFLKEREQYEYRIAEMDKERNELQNKHDFLAEEKYEFQLRCDVLQADREKLKVKVRDLEDKVPEPEQKAKEEQHLLSLQAQLVALQVSNTDAKKEVFKLKEEIRVLNKLKREPVQMVDRASSALVDEEEEADENQRKERYAEVEYELSESKKTSMRLLSENDQLKSINAELESKIANTELRINKLDEELTQKKAEVDDLSVLVQGGENLNQDFLALQDKVKDLSALRQALAGELIQEKKVSKLKIMELNKDLEAAQDKVNALDKERMKQDGELNKLQHENDAQQKVTEAQALELRNMKAQLEQMQNILEDKSSKYNEMKKTDKEAQEELREMRIQLHVVQRELDDLRLEKAGKYGKLTHEMESAKAQREAETEQMRKETLLLREEVKRLKDYEFKITTMDSEIRRLMNRLRITERYKKMPKKPAEPDQEKEEISELKKKQRVLEREKMTLLQEKKQWEILKDKYTDLQKNNRRLTEENKRVRGDIDGTSYKVDALEKKFKTLNINVKDDITESKQIQKATYVDKPEKRRPPRKVVKSHDVNSKETKPPKYNEIKQSNEESSMKGQAGRQLLSKTRSPRKQTRFTEPRKFERKSTRTADDLHGMRAKKPVLPHVDTADTGLTYGRGYRELHKNRYRPSVSLELL